MSAEIENMMYVGDTPWHGLGVYVGEEPVTSKEAIVAAGLDWEVEKRPLWAENDKKDVSLKIETHEAVVRETDNRVLGVVGKMYQPVQNVEAFEFMDALVKDGSMRYHTAGSLRNGQRIWLLGKIGSFDVVKSDTVEKYLFLYNTHDGSGALRALETAIRVVCANTARAALDQGKGEGYYFRHTTNIMKRIEAAREALGLAQKEFEKFGEFAKALAKLKMPEKKFEGLSNVLIPDNTEAKSNTRAENARQELVDLFNFGRGQDILGVRGTGWAAYSAIVEFANYKRTSRGGEEAQARRFESSLFGSGNNFIQSGVDELQTMLKAA